MQGGRPRAPAPGETAARLTNGARRGGRRGPPRRRGAARGSRPLGGRTPPAGRPSCRGARRRRPPAPPPSSSPATDGLGRAAASTEEGIGGVLERRGIARWWCPSRLRLRRRRGMEPTGLAEVVANGGRQQGRAGIKGKPQAIDGPGPTTGLLIFAWWLWCPRPVVFEPVF